MKPPALSTVAIIDTMEAPVLTFRIRRARTSARKPQQIHRTASRCVYNQL